MCYKIKFKVYTFSHSFVLMEKWLLKDMVIWSAFLFKLTIWQRYVDSFFKSSTESIINVPGMVCGSQHKHWLVFTPTETSCTRSVMKLRMCGRESQHAVHRLPRKTSCQFRFGKCVWDRNASYSTCGSVAGQSPSPSLDHQLNTSLPKYVSTRQLARSCLTAPYIMFRQKGLCVS